MPMPFFHLPTGGRISAQRRSMRMRPAVCSFLLVFLLASATPSMAIFDQGFDWKDSNHKLKVCLDDTGCPAGMRDSLQAAIDLWNAKHLTWTFTLVNDCAGADVTVNCGNISGLGSTSTNTGWKTNTTKATVTVKQGADWGWCDDKYELVSTLAHELGHCARLDDTPAADQSKVMRGAQDKAGHNRGPAAADSTEAATSDTAKVVTVETTPKKQENHQTFSGNLRPAPGTAPFMLDHALTFRVDPFEPGELQILNWVPLDPNTLQITAQTNCISTPDMQVFFVKITYAESTAVRPGVLFIPSSPWIEGWGPVVVAPPDTTVPTDTSAVRLYPFHSVHPGGPVTEMVSFKWVVDHTTGYKFQGLEGTLRLPAGLHTITLQGRDQAGNEGADSMMVMVLLATAVPAGGEGAGAQLALQLANPTSRGAPLSLSYAAPARVELEIKVYDVGGRLVRTLFEGVHPGGERRLTWDLADAAGRRVAAGVYLISLQSGRRVLSRKAVITQ
jgi:hypothetical protein